MYQPAEDSLLLEKYSEELSKGNVLDMGTGLGIQAIAAAKNRTVTNIIATDIDKETISYCKRNIKNKKIKFIISDLFSSIGKFDMSEINGKISEHPKKSQFFDTIIFNPPYLPEEKDLKIKDKALYGGKQGIELIERFFLQARKYLNKNGIVLMVFSSITGKSKVNNIIKKSGFKFKELDKQHIFFEDIYAYEIKKR